MFHKYKNLLLGEWILLAVFFLQVAGELLDEFMVFSDISSWSCLWCCWALLRINLNFLSFSFSSAFPVKGHTELKYFARETCSPTLNCLPRPWLYNHSALRLSMGSTTNPSITLTLMHQFSTKGRWSKPLKQMISVKRGDRSIDRVLTQIPQSFERKDYHWWWCCSSYIDEIKCIFHSNQVCCSLIDSELLSCLVGISRIVEDVSSDYH